MLRPGPGTSADEVARNQRRRLFAAMVACLAGRGYEATRVADLVEVSGVSSRSFYNLFPSKAACFAATFEAIVAAAKASLAKARDPRASWEEQVRQLYEELGRTIAEQPAAARLCLFETYAAGAEAREPLQRALAEFDEMTKNQLMELPERRAIPADLIHAHSGALQEIIRTRLREDNAETPEQLKALAPDLTKLMLSYRPPPEPLRLSTRPRSFGPESVVAHEDAERVLRAFAIVVAERGYSGATIHEVAKRGSMSPTTFYASFRDKEEALLAAIDSVGDQLVAAAMAAFQRNQDWPTGVRAAIGSMLNYLASRPAMAHLFGVGVYAGGAIAVGRRAQVLKPLAALLTEGYERSQDVPSLATEAIAGGILALVYRRLENGGPASLPALAPVATYIALSPFIGAEAACVAANSQGREPASEPLVARESMVPPTKWSLVAILAVRPAGTEELATAVGMPVDAVSRYARELESEGLIEREEFPPQGTSARWQLRFKHRFLDHEDWDRLSREKREELSNELVVELQEDFTRSIESGIFHRRLDKGLARVPFTVDEQGWRELLDIQRAALQAYHEVQLRSLERLKSSGEAGIHGHAVQALFEMPED